MVKAKRKQDNRKQVTLSLDPALWAQTQDRAKQDKRTFSAVVELALAAYLAAQEKSV